jgi:hypothetical protein
MSFNLGDRVNHISVRPIIGVGTIVEVLHDGRYFKVKWENEGVFVGQPATYAEHVMDKDSLKLAGA